MRIRRVVSARVPAGSSRTRGKALVRLAFLIAPLATPVVIWLVFSVVYLVRARFSGDMDYARLMGNVWVWSAYAVPVAYFVTLLGAVPAYYWLRRRGSMGLRHFVALGAVLGALPFLLFDVWAVFYELHQVLRHGWSHSVFGAGPRGARILDDVGIAAAWLGIGLACGLACSVVFWALGVRGRLNQGKG